MLYNKLRFFKYLLLPFQIIYSLVVFTRNRLYDYHILTAFHASPLIISIGNLNIGGTGKTPMTEYLIKLFKQQNIAILSRGYKRKTKGFIIAQKGLCLAKDIGDENSQLYNKFPNIIIACDNNRVNGIKKLIQYDDQIDVFLLDDAFQHRKLKRDIDILLTSYNDLFIHDQLLPIGCLREHKYEARRANIIIVTKCPKHISLANMDLITMKIKTETHQKVYFSYISQYKYLNMQSLTEIELDTHETHILLTGIATSHTILKHLEDKKINYQHLEFADHYDFKINDILKIIQLKEKLNRSNNLLLTEKDYYRLSTKHRQNLQNHFNLICIQIECDFIASHKSDFNNELLNFKKYKL